MKVMGRKRKVGARRKKNLLPKVNRHHDAHAISLPKRRDEDARAMNRFETLGQARVEMDTRIEMLSEALNKGIIPQIHRKPAKELLRKLELCEAKKKKHCSSPACPLCTRRRRIGFVKSFSKFYKKKKYKGVAFVTLLSKKWSVKDTSYVGMQLPAIKVQLKYQMKVAGFTKKNFMVGFIEAEHIEDKGRIDFHVHMLIPFKNKTFIEPRLKILGNRFYADRIDGVTRAMHAPIRNLAKIDLNQKIKIIAYIYKSFWGRSDKFLRLTGQKVRMKEPMHSVMLVFQDAHRPSEFRFVGGRRILPSGKVKKCRN